jgi:DNA-binding MltR family transcriptional regulator
MSRRTTSPRPQEWKKLIDKYQNTSDRSVAILSTTQLMIRLGNLLATFMVDNQGIRKRLLKEGQPLGTFGVRVDLAFGLGLISPKEFHDLKVIELIRDQFLDEARGGNFTDDGVQERCYMLKLPREVLLPDQTTTPRRFFIFATTLLLQQIVFRTRKIENQRRKPPEDFILMNAKR